jgi:hypothetical protein
VSVHVEFCVNGGVVERLGPGAVIGRSAMASLRVNDPAISEAHAMVSLRGSALRLLSLRGRFVVAGQRINDVLLSPGLTVELAPSISLEVTAVVLPASIPALTIEGLGTLVPPSVASLFAARAAPVSGLSLDADAVLWTSDHVLHLRRLNEPDRVLAVGDSFVVGARTYGVVSMPLAAADTSVTNANAQFALPLVLVVRFDTVHVWRGEVAVAIDGIPARVLSELALMGVPAEWRNVAREIWPEEGDDRRLRMNWDAGLSRLRSRMREAGIRSDLVRSVGAGLLELFLGPDDRVIDDS